MVSSADRPPDSSAERATAAAAESRRQARTPIAVWVLYVLGILGAVILTTSLLFAVVVAAADDTGLDFEISAAFLVWLALVVVAASTWVIRRFGSPR